MKKLKWLIENTKASWSMCVALLQEKDRTTKEKIGIVFFGVFGGILWTWVTDGLAEEEKIWHERSL